MIEIIQSIIVGGIQGISEFLPISSSGHLVIIPYIFKWDYNGLNFDIALHFGTVIAIVVYFWKDWMGIITEAIKNLQFTIYNLQSNSNGKMTNEKRAMENSIYPPNLLWQILVASIPAAILGLFLDEYVETYLHSPLLIAFNLAFFGVLLWLMDKYSKSTYAIKNITFAQSFLIGCAQAVALFPGVSRSGITMTAARSIGLDRKNAARFSFLLATPAMIGAFLISAKEIVGQDLNLVFLSGVVASTVFGFFAIKYLLKYLEKGNFSVFVWYRIVLALAILFIYFTR